MSTAASRDEPRLTPAFGRERSGGHSGEVSPEHEPPAHATGSAADGPPAEAGRRRSLAAALFLGAAGTALVLVAGGRPWAEAVTSVAQGAVPLTAYGRDVTGIPAALAVVALASLVAVFAVRRSGRTLVASVLALCGAAVVITSVLGAHDTATLEAGAAEATGLAGAGVRNVTHTAWPWVSAAAGALLLGAGALALRHGRHWPAMSGRYERPAQAGPAAGRAPADPDRPEEIWKALDRGDDPTRDR